MKKGFTLIELLVVIAIIALLVTLTVPSITKGLGAGRDALCKSNMRSIGTAFFGYTADHTVHPMVFGEPGKDGYTPSTMPWYEARWEYRLLPYLKGGEEKMTFSNNELRIRAMQAGVFLCPEFPYRKDVRLDNGGTLSGNQMVISYAMNHWLNGAMQDAGELNDVRKKAAWSPSLVPHASKMLLLVDIMNTPSIRRKGLFEPVLVPMSVHYRHDRQANLAYYDGAVRSFTTEQGDLLAQDPDFIYVPDSAVYLSRMEK